MRIHVAFEAINGLGLFRQLDRTCDGTSVCRCRRCTSADLARHLREPYRSQVQTPTAKQR